MHRMGRWLALLLCLLGGLTGRVALAGLPPAIEAALAQAKIPASAMGLLVVDADGLDKAPRLSHRAQTPMNPASVMKLTTTFAALDLLGPAYTWSTPVYLDGPVRDGQLAGNLYIRGQGDPKLVLERLWLLLRRVQGLGIRSIQGDIVLDHSAWDIPDADPALFDGEPLRPYNAAPDALLLNYKAVVMTFTPDRASQTARVQYDPQLAGVQLQPSVPLLAADCADYRAALKGDLADPGRMRFLGGYPAACGERVWPVAYADPRSYAPRAVQGLWQEMGGRLGGSARWGVLPAALAAGKPAFELPSVSLAEVVRDTNKFSNNVMAQQLFLTLGQALAADTPPAAVLGDPPEGSPAEPLAQGSFPAARAALQRWWKARIGGTDLPVWDNGSGLSRHERISAQALATMLQVAYRAPTMSELMASLPITGVDGTLKRAKTPKLGSAHLKTGSLNQVAARAGYVDGASGRRYVLAVFINHPQAGSEAARSLLETVVNWTIQDL